MFDNFLKDFFNEILKLIWNERAILKLHLRQNSTLTHTF